MSVSCLELAYPEGDNLSMPGLYVSQGIVYRRNFSPALGAETRPKKQEAWKFLGRVSGVKISGHAHQVAELTFLWPRFTFEDFHAGHVDRFEFHFAQDDINPKQTRRRIVHAEVISSVINGEGATLTLVLRDAKNTISLT